MELKWGLSVNKWSDVKCSDVEWTDVIYVKWFCFEVKWVTVKFLGTKEPCTLGWPYIEGTWLYCEYFIWCVSCTVVVLTCFVMCGCLCMCGCFGIMCACVYCVLYCLYCVFCTVSFMYIYSYLFCLWPIHIQSAAFNVTHFESRITHLLDTAINTTEHG